MLSLLLAIVFPRLFIVSAHVYKVIFRALPFGGTFTVISNVANIYLIKMITSIHKKAHGNRFAPVSVGSTKS